jgi:DNA-binding XRE family transcriptional regulator
MDIGQEDLATKIGTSATTLRLIMLGKKLANLEMGVSIDKMTGGLVSASEAMACNSTYLNMSFDDRAFSLKRARQQCAERGMRLS